jgi:hypothetical protein
VVRTVGALPLELRQPKSTTGLEPATTRLRGEVSHHYAPDLTRLLPENQVEHGTISLLSQTELPADKSAGLDSNQRPKIPRSIRTLRTGDLVVGSRELKRSRIGFFAREVTATFAPGVAAQTLTSPKGDGEELGISEN